MDSTSGHITTDVPASTVSQQDSSLSKVLEAGIIAEKAVQVTNNEQHIVWEGYGLRLHIPSNSLPENCSQFELKMSVSRSQSYKLPEEDGVLVSAIYSFSHEFEDIELLQPVTLEMQHCAASSAVGDLSIVRAAELSDAEFKLLPGGEFDDNGYGAIKLRHLCCFAVYLKWKMASNINMCAKPYYLIHPNHFYVHLFIVPHLQAVFKVQL